MKLKDCEDKMYKLQNEMKTNGKTLLKCIYICGIILNSNINLLALSLDEIQLSARPDSFTFYHSINHKWKLLKDSKAATNNNENRRTLFFGVLLYFLFFYFVCKSSAEKKLNFNKFSSELSAFIVVNFPKVGGHI